MNQLYLLEPKLTFGENDHPFCETGFSVVTRRVNCLLDTGFSLGFAFSNRAIKKFGYKDGYVMSMLLGNGRPIKGTVFVVELIAKINRIDRNLGQTSVVFMEKEGDPLIGIETMKLLSPIGLDWENKVVSWRE